ncbi:S8 family serine peptidase [Thalassotalea fonticola]|uniref:S8 family serine peptidase n=1 Tax=Thalassotalea fonticola TaxID=3065649 RepID=A0ABZ0GS20_9GAMM|nr:S8 family serine peptidase [Colwelliaceae bacterium S1-1]
MIFKKSTLAFCVTSLVTASSYAISMSNTTSELQSDSDTISIYEQPTTSIKTYLVTLSSAGALVQAMEDQNISREQASLQINASQESVIDEILTLDQHAVVGTRFRVVGNMMYVKMTGVAATQLMQNSLVSSVNAIDESDAEFIDQEESPYAKLQVNDDGGHTVVALIGSGVDYTHATLGGEGTFAAYNKGYANLTNYWGGFPNNVVIGGFDFASEKGAYDYNPLEYPADFQSPYNSLQQYKGGIGTMAASLIRQSAGDAKILAYKTSGITFNQYVRYEGRRTFALALEMAMDPNQDGDMSDSADILLINYANSVSSYYREQETGGNHFTVQTALIRAAAATGSLVVVPAGNDDYYKFHNYYSMSYRGAVQEALTVGYSEHKDGAYRVAGNSPFGPTRGESILKPDILALNRNVKGAAAAGGAIFKEMEANEYLIAAKVAGTAASIMESHPDLSNEEVKALIVNTGILDIEQHWGVAQIGGGSINPLAANKSYALMMEESTLLPSIHLGNQPVFDKAGFTRNIIIKNLTEESQSYDAEIIINGERLSNQAIDVVMPEHIVLAPNEVKAVTVSFNVDADKLPVTPIRKGGDFTLENWEQLAINGFIKLNHERNPGASIHMPWLVIPQRSSPFVADAETNDFTPIHNEQYYLDKGEEFPELPHSADWQDSAKYDIRFAHYQAEITNTSNIEQDLYAMPLFYNATQKPEQGLGNHGHYIKSLAGGLYPEQQCESGRKLSLAVRLFESFEIPMSNHPDRMGSRLLNINLHNQINVALADGSNFMLDAVKRERGKLTTLSVDLAEDNSFTSNYVDLSMEFNVFDPRARVKNTGLPLVVSPGGDSLIINICTDKMYHDEINHTTFEEPIAMQFVSDRQSLPGVDDPIMMHNFFLNGDMIDVVIADENEEAQPVDDSCDDGYNKDNAGNCIRVFTSPLTMSLFSYFYDGYFDLNEKEKFELSTYDYSCDDAVQGLKKCSLSHPRFNKTLTFSVPEAIEFNGSVICDFPANNTLASCLADGISDIDGIDESAFRRDIDFNNLLNEPELSIDAAYSLHTGSAIKIANMVDDEPVEWKSHLTVPPQGKVSVSFYLDNRCASLFRDDRCLPGAVVFNPTLSYFAVADGSGDVQAIKPGQSFSVPENAQNGQIIGRVQMAEEQITQLNNQRILLIDGGQGAPFQLSEDGVLAVRDSSMLDYEQNKTYQLMVAANWGKVWGKQLPITIGVANVNDNAPLQVANIEHIKAKQQQELAAIDLAKYFIDADNQGLIFTATDLPLGLTLDKAGILGGSPVSKGDYSATVNVTDGANRLKAKINFEITSANEDAQTTDAEPSAGSMFISLCMLLMLVRRRYC